MKIAFTGHRPNKLGNDYNLTSPLIKWIRTEIITILAMKQPDSLIIGMALGIDTLVAEIGIDYNIPFIAAIPFKRQDDKWPLKSREHYNYLLSKAALIVNVSGKDFYKPEYMQDRNKWMVDRGDVLVAIWDGTSGGTCNCVEYAKQVGREIVYINPKNFKQ